MYPRTLDKSIQSRLLQSSSFYCLISACSARTGADTPGFSGAITRGCRLMNIFIYVLTAFAPATVAILTLYLFILFNAFLVSS